MPKPPRRPWKTVKLMETKLLWTGPSLRVKVALEVVAEAEVALEAEVVAAEAEVDLVAEAGEALEVRSREGCLCVYMCTCAQNLCWPGFLPSGIANHLGLGRGPTGSFATVRL